MTATEAIALVTGLLVCFICAGISEFKKDHASLRAGRRIVPLAAGILLSALLVVNIVRPVVSSHPYASISLAALSVLMAVLAFTSRYKLTLASRLTVGANCVLSLLWELNRIIS